AGGGQRAVAPKSAPDEDVALQPAHGRGRQRVHGQRAVGGLELEIDERRIERRVGGTDQIGRGDIDEIVGADARAVEVEGGGGNLNPARRVGGSVKRRGGEKRNGF